MPEENTTASSATRRCAAGRAAPDDPDVSGDLPPVALLTKYGTLGLGLIFAFTFAVFLSDRRLVRLADETDLLRVPGVLATLAAVLLLLLLGLVLPRVWHGSAWILRATLGVGIVLNVLWFNSVDPSPGQSSFKPRQSRAFSALGDRKGWYNHWKIHKLFTHMHDHMRGSTIIAFEPDKPTYLEFTTLFHPYYLKYIAEITDYRAEEYDYELSPSQVEYLLAYDHVRFEDLYYTKFVWVILKDQGPLRDTYYVLKGADTYFLVRASRLHEVRGQ